MIYCLYVDGYIDIFEFCAHYGNIYMSKLLRNVETKKSAYNKVLTFCMDGIF